MNYRVTHQTEYAYSEPVSVSHQILHLLPRPHPRQVCGSARLEITPTPATQRDRLDYFGNRETFCSMREPHNKLVILSESEITVTAPDPLEPAETPPWETVRDCARLDLAAAGLVCDSPLVRLAPPYALYAGETFHAGRPVLEGLLELTARILADFKYDRQATSVGTPLEVAFATRRGVCQDFAHVMIACLRSLGLPARYVSGYIRTRAKPGQAQLIGADASHAWVAAFLPGGTWVDLDPTNNILASTEHLTVAWGRDYADVTPARGVILGGGQQTLSVAVNVRATDP